MAEEHASELKIEQFTTAGLASANKQDLEMWAEVIVELEWLELPYFNSSKYSLRENLILIFLIEFFLVTVQDREAHREIDRILVVVVKYVNGWKVDWITNLSNLAARFYEENRTEKQILEDLFHALGYELELEG